MEYQVPDSRKVSPTIVFFLIHSVQVGIGIMSFQKEIVKYAEYDAWISIIIAGILVNFILFLLYKILNKEKADIIFINRQLFGKWIGNIFNLLLIIYLISITLVIIRMFVEIIQVWMFPFLNLFAISIVTLLLVYYIIDGGFRVVTGISFLGIVIPLFLGFTIVFPLEFAHYENLLPVFDQSIVEYLQSTKVMLFSFLGFETLFFYYPFIKNPEKSHKWAQFGVIFTTLLYLATAIVTFVFFDRNQIETVIWPTLEIWKIVEVPFVERFEYIGISAWVLVILPNIALPIWAASRGVKRITGINQRFVVVISLLACFTSLFLIKKHTFISFLSNILSYFGLGIFAFYIPFLFIVQTIYYKVRKSK
jgi:spore germination protein (amino acid permease)